MQMSKANEPRDNYDVAAWTAFYAAHPGFHRSVGAEGAGEGGDDGEGGGGDPNAGGDDPNNGGGGEPVRLTDDLRATIAGDDEAFRNYLGRQADLGSLAKSAWNAHQRISAGEVLRPLPENATDEDIAAYRKQQGIPDEPAGYFENLPDGLVIGEEDQPIFDTFAEFAHGRNWTPKQMADGIEWYNSFTEEQRAARAEADAEVASEMEEAFREEWGPDYKGNLNRINGMLAATFGEESMEMFRSARDAEGRPLMSSPEVLRGMNALARAINPAGHLISGEGATKLESVQDEIDKIEKVMREERHKYNADEKMQQRYRDLLEAREKMNEQGKQKVA